MKHVGPLELVTYLAPTSPPRLAQGQALPQQRSTRTHRRSPTPGLLGSNLPGEGKAGAMGGVSIGEEPASQQGLPTVTFKLGSGTLKGEDVVVTQLHRVWPSTTALQDPSAPLINSLDSPASQPSSSSPAAAAAGASGSSSSAGAAAAAGGLNHYSLWCVFDGHNGPGAAAAAAEHVLEILEDFLPPGPPDPSSTAFQGEVQRALVETIAAINLMVADRGIAAGCTATVVLQVGWLVTCANVGDSRALLDTGRDLITLTVDHRVATNQIDRRRLEAVGATIAPIDFSGSGPAKNEKNGVGPLRVWPGGLCLSRAVGDFDVGDFVVPISHVCQVVLPPTGGRIMLGSDGVWDAFDRMAKIGSMARSYPLETCAEGVIQFIIRVFGGLRDDTSLIVVDVLPPGTTFQDTVAAAKKLGKSSSASGAAGGGGGVGSPSKSSGGGGGCLCFGGGAVADEEETSRPAPPPPADPSVRGGQSSCQAQMVANLDAAVVMGLVPEQSEAAPSWFKPAVKDRLIDMMVEASRSWDQVVGQRLTTPGFQPEYGEGRIYRRASQMFQESVVSEEEYGLKFGKFSSQPLYGARRAPPEYGVPGAQMPPDMSVRAGHNYPGTVAK